MTRFDWLILTAANFAQMRGYQAQLHARSRRGALEGILNWRVIPDPGGNRVGSGGSTLWVLYQLARELLRTKRSARSLQELFEGCRILIIHSGGDSRRLCAYAAQGKIFLPLPCSTRDGQPASLFDLILERLAALPAPEKGHVLIASGDVLLTFDPGEVQFSRPGVVGVAYPGPFERGSKHGVYVASRDGTVTDFLQKPDEQLARQRKALDTAGRVLVDTGLLSLDPPAVERWLNAAGAAVKRQKICAGRGIISQLAAHRSFSLDLYEHLLMAVASALDEGTYLRSVSQHDRSDKTDPARRHQLVALRRALHGQDFSVNVLSYCDFFHIGSTRELLANMGTLNRTARLYNFANLYRAKVAVHASLEGTFLYNSILKAPRINCGEGVLIESVDACGDVILPGRNIVVGWPPQARLPLRLPEGWGIVCLPVRGPQFPQQGKDEDPWIAVAFGVDDDFKTVASKAGTFGNRPLTEFMERNGLGSDWLWPRLKEDRRNLWEARLWTPGPIDRAVKLALQICGNKALPPEWHKSPLPKRLSMSQILKLVDHRRLLEHRERIQRLGELHHLDESLAQDSWLPASRVLELAEDRKTAAVAMKHVDSLMQRSDPLARARLLRLAHALHQRFGVVLPSRPDLKGGDLEHSAFEAVAGAVAQQIELPDEPRAAAVLHDQAVWVTCPVRIDFAGGWSDTPPICQELGGSVVNAAVTLNGQYPVQVIAKLTHRPVITLNSLDLGQRVEITETPHPREYQDPRQWSTLPKAALILGGICPRNPAIPLRRWLDRLGGGLEFTTFSAVPKGSGLGTSSILGAAMLACIARVVGEAVSTDTLIARTSALEQFMTTGGGWQDQVGGITPGVKLIRTQPGLEQRPSLHRAVFDLSREGELRSRLLFYYTGYQRMAKNILQNIVGRYLARDPKSVSLIHRLKIGAEQMKTDLDAGDINAFARGIQNYWDLKKQLDPGSTNDKIEALLQPLNKYLSGKVLAGAGGGGFVFMVARDSQAALKVRRLLGQHPPNRMARFFDFDVEPGALSVTVL